MVWCPHTTAGIYCNEGADPDVVTDVESTLEQMVPPRQDYLHAEGNSHAHIRSILTGCSLLVPVEDGELKLGTWQHVFFPSSMVLGLDRCGCSFFRVCDIRVAAGKCLSSRPGGLHRPDNVKTT